MSLVNKEIRISPYPLRSMISRRNKSVETPSSTPVLGKHKGIPNSNNSIELLTNTNYKSPAFIELLTRIKEGLNFYPPELCEEGVNGTYFLKDKTGKKIGVFKPQDEEGASENNPKRNEKSFSSKSNQLDLPSKGIFPGEAALREVAAHLIDHENLFGVPKTQIVKITTRFSNLNAEDTKETENIRTKIGSLQEFVDNDGSSEDFGSRTFPVNEVHKIGILDIQMLNVDRHEGNILVKKQRNGSVNLIPIDHGFSLPDNLECAWFEWMSWPQAKIPFDDEMKSYIFRIDVEADIHLLQSTLRIRPECLNTMRITTSLLKKAVEFNLTLYDIASIICRKNYDLSSPSQLEIISKKAASASSFDSINSSVTINVLDERKELSNSNIKDTSSYLDAFMLLIEQEIKNLNVNSKKSDKRM